jgi:hypothetical protein
VLTEAALSGKVDYLRRLNVRGDGQTLDFRRAGGIATHVPVDDAPSLPPPVQATQYKFGSLESPTLGQSCL